MMEDTASIYRDIITKKINKINKQSEITSFINMNVKESKESDDNKKKEKKKETIKKNTDIRNFFPASKQ
jgi:hypothetical protein